MEMDLTTLVFGILVFLLIKLFVAGVPQPEKREGKKKEKNVPEAESIQAVVKELWVYPIKSCHGISLQESTLSETGLKWDRQWMLVRKTEGEEGELRFVTARQFSSMVTIQPSFHGEFLHVDAPGMDTLKIALKYAEPSSDAYCGVKVWSDSTFGADEGEEAAAWFNSFLSEKHPSEFSKLGPVRLVRYYPKEKKESRATAASSLNASNQVSFADAHPFLLVSLESVQEIDKRIEGLTVEHRRFRGNIIVTGHDSKLAPFEEETWQTCSIGTSKFSCVCPVERCRMTTIEPEEGYFDPNQQPLNTVNAKESNPKCFGIGLQHLKESEGQKIRIGMNLFASKI